MAPSRQRLDATALVEALASLPEWRMSSDGKAIERRFVFDDFVAAFAFMTEVALAAEKLDHHPDWSNVWNRVDLRLSTHDRGGVTEFDLTLAGACDRAAGRRRAVV